MPLLHSLAWWTAPDVGGIQFGAGHAPQRPRSREPHSNCKHNTFLCLTNCLPSRGSLPQLELEVIDEG